MINQSIPTINQSVVLVKIEPFENSITFINRIADSIVGDLQLHVVHKTEHRFSPQGFTLVWVLSESHLAIHTWPELGYIHIDLVTCSSRGNDKFEESVKRSVSNCVIQSFSAKTIVI